MKLSSSLMFNKSEIDSKKLYECEWHFGKRISFNQINKQKENGNRVGLTFSVKELKK